MIHLTAFGQPPGGSSSVHIYTQTIQRTTQNNTQNNTKNQEECGPCPVFAGFTLAFDLQLRKKHGKTSVRVVIHKHTMRIHSHNENTQFYAITQARSQSGGNWLSMVSTGRLPYMYYRSWSFPVCENGLSLVTFSMGLSFNIYNVRPSVRVSVTLCFS